MSTSYASKTKRIGRGASNSLLCMYVVCQATAICSCINQEAMLCGGSVGWEDTSGRFISRQQDKVGIMAILGY